MQIESLADIAGDNAVHPIAATGQPYARTLLLCAIGGSARFGAKATVGAAVGVALAQNVPLEISGNAEDYTDTIDLTQAAAYVPSGTTLTIAYAL